MIDKKEIPNMKIILTIIVGTFFLVLPQSALVWGWDQGEQPYSSPTSSYGSYGCGGYCAGEQDAQYDLQNNQQYQPQGSCLPCHSPDYWNNFRQGYDHYWNQHQEQNQGASVNIYGNNNYVSMNQYQTQNPLQQLAHLACGFLNCNQGGGYDNGGPR